jgi:hypothetical protein
MSTTLEQASELSPESIAGLQASFRGEVIAPNAAGYDQARRVYNAMIDKRPALLVRAVDAGDVMTALHFGRHHDLAVAVRGGGHNGGGLGTVDDGLVIDLSQMRGIRVDPILRTAVVEGGATLGDVDHATHAHGLAVPGGIISTTGAGGLTLGGGIGHLTRGCGLTIDNLLEADIVLADGSFVTTNADQNPDLFWAIRGGGGNFGVVTSFTYRLHPISTVVAGPTFYELDRTEEVLRWYREFLPAAPRELTGFFAFLTVPPGPPFPEHLHMKKVCGVVWCYSGLLAEAERVLKPVRDFGPMLMDGLMEMPLPAWQSAFDALYPPGDQWYWRADFVNELSDAAINRHAEFGPKLPTWKSTMHLYPIDGVASEPSDNETAWAYRSSKWAEVIVGVDPDPANAELIKNWTVDYWEALHPYSAGGAYVNFMMDEGQDRVQATYRGNYERLAEIKRKYDPTNFFHVNQNVRPAS